MDLRRKKKVASLGPWLENDDDINDDLDINALCKAPTKGVIFWKSLIRSFATQYQTSYDKTQDSFQQSSNNGNANQGSKRWLPSNIDNARPHFQWPVHARNLRQTAFEYETLHTQNGMKMNVLDMLLPDAFYQHEREQEQVKDFHAAQSTLCFAKALMKDMLKETARALQGHGGSDRDGWETVGDDNRPVANWKFVAAQLETLPILQAKGAFPLTDKTKERIMKRLSSIYRPVLAKESAVVASSSISHGPDQVPSSPLKKKRLVDRKMYVLNKKKVTDEQSQVIGKNMSTGKLKGHVVPSPIARVRLCTEVNCQKQAIKGGISGLCKNHGGGQRCTYDGCEKSSQSGGLCRRHGGGKSCSFEGCTSGPQRDGLCHIHGGIKRCSVAGCERKDRGYGYCVAHS